MQDGLTEGHNRHLVECYYRSKIKDFTKIACKTKGKYAVHRAQNRLHWSFGQLINTKVQRPCYSLELSPDWLSGSMTLVLIPSLPYYTKGHFGTAPATSSSHTTTWHAELYADHRAKAWKLTVWMVISYNKADQYFPLSTSSLQQKFTAFILVTTIP